MDIKDRIALLYFIFLTIGNILCFIFYGWELFLVLFFIGISTNLLVGFNFEKRGL